MVPRILAVLSIVAIPSTVLAQELPEGIAKRDKASEGKTEVAEEGFEGAGSLEGEDTDATEANLSAGGLVTAGNSEQIALTSSAKMRLRRDVHQFGSAAAANFARASSAETSGMETTVENLQGRVRYDYFFADHWSVFLGVSARRDRFQGLDLRLNIDPGVAHYFIDESERQLWAELGYDLQYDVRRDENIAEAAADGQRVEKTETRHSGRAFVGYDDQVNERVSFYTGVEYIQSVQDTKKWRLNWDGSLTSNIAGQLSSAVTISLKYDNAPLPGIEELDVLTSFNLVYALL